MRRNGNVIFLIGCLLVLGSFTLLVFSRLQVSRSAAKAVELAAQLEDILPPRTPGIPEAYTNMEMPAISVNGYDFIGIVEIPAFQTALPIGSVWDSGTVSSFPCRFWGTVYDSSLILGGADQTGQFDFLKQIQHGDSVLVTDMTGAEFSYRVERIIRTTSADAEILLEQDSDLILFARQARSPEYIIVRCAAG